MRALALLVALLSAVCSGQQTWQVLAKDIETIVIGISFVNETHGWVPGDQNGVGALFLSTTDGGKTWNPVPHDGYVTLPLGIAMQQLKNGTVQGVIGGIGIGRNFSSLEYSPNGQVFHAPPNDPNIFGESQDSKVIVGVDGAFALAGQYEDKKAKAYNGVTVSFDGGQSWTDYDVGSPTPLSRYGHYPSATTWYLALGDFPSSVSTRDGHYKVLSNKLALDKQTGRVVVRDHAHRSPAHSRHLLQTAGYAAAISKTTDGGKTWTTLYNDTGNFYFNDIDCPTVSDCWVVGESESDSPQPGVRILHTSDGGANWDIQLYVNNPDYSLLDVAFLNATEGWAVGAIFSRGITGLFYHTTDGGKTWLNQQTLNDEYPSALSFYQPPGGGPYYGWATALTREGLSSILGYF